MGLFVGFLLLLLLSWRSSLHVSAIDSLSDIWFVNISTHSVGILAFYSPEGVFWCTKVFILTKSDLPLLLLLPVSLVSCPIQEVIAKASAGKLLSYVSFSEFESFGFTLRVHFELIFVYHVVLLQVEIQLPPHRWLRRSSFLHRLPLVSFPKSSDHTHESSFLHTLFHLPVCLRLCRHHTIFINIVSL